MENGQKEKKFISLVVYLHNVEDYVIRGLFRLYLVIETIMK